MGKQKYLRRRTLAAIVGVGTCCLLAIAGCAQKQPPPTSAERTALEQSLALSLQGARKDGSPAFDHNAESDIRRLLLLDRDEMYYEKTVEHVGNLIEILDKRNRDPEADKLRGELKRYNEWQEQRKMGQEAASQNDHIAAEQHLRKGIDAAEHLDPLLFAKYSQNLMVDYVDLAYALQKQNRISEAEQVHRKVLGLTIRSEGKNSEAAQGVQLSLVQFYCDTNQRGKALAHLERMITKFPHNLEARQKRAQIYSAMGKHAAAIKDLDVALDENPEAWPLYLLRAHEYNATNQPDEAIEDAQAAMSQQALALQARERLVDAYLLKGQHKEALAELDEILKAKPEDAWAKQKHKEATEKVASQK